MYGKNNKIYILGELPKPKDKTSIICLRSEILTGVKQHCNSISEPVAESKRVNKILKKLTSNYDNVVFIDLTGVFCNEKVCDYALNGKALFMPDGGHLSGYGSEIAWNYVVNHIKSN